MAEPSPQEPATTSTNNVAANVEVDTSVGQPSITVQSAALLT